MIKIAEFNGYEIIADVESGSLIARYEDATENMETRLDPFKLEILDPIEDYLTYVLKAKLEEMFKLDMECIIYNYPYGKNDYSNDEE